MYHTTFVNYHSCLYRYHLYHCFNLYIIYIYIYIYIYINIDGFMPGEQYPSAYNRLVKKAVERGVIKPTGCPERLINF